MRIEVCIQQIQCPYCWETFEVTIDGSELVEGQASYTEDCYICCRPILLTIAKDDIDEMSVLVDAELR